jgi:hypothetical protein
MNMIQNPPPDVICVGLTTPDNTMLVCYHNRGPVAHRDKNGKVYGCVWVDNHPPVYSNHEDEYRFTVTTADHHEIVRKFYSRWLVYFTDNGQFVVVHTRLADIETERLLILPPDPIIAYELEFRKKYLL